LENKKVIIISDSTCDLSKELIEKYDIKILPLGVTLGDKTYADGVDINADKIYEYYNSTGTLPKTSAINLGEAEDFFAQYANKGNEIVYFSISSEMSTSYRNCLLASESFEDVYVIDTKNLSTGGGLLVLSAAIMAEQGADASAIVEEIEKLKPCVDASFIIDKLEYLHKGGRCSSVAALGANLLKIKPCISVVNGKMGVGKKYRGKFVDTVKEYVADHIGDPSTVKCDHVFVTHAGCPDEVVNAAIEKTREFLNPENLYITRAGCTVSSHCGPDTIGVLFIRKSPIA